MTTANLGQPGFGGPDAVQTVAETAESLLTFENAALPLAVCDPTGRIVMCNRALRALLGYELDELLGKPVGDVVATDPAGKYNTWRERLDPSAEAITGEQRRTLLRRDGTTISVRASSAVVRDDEGQVRYVIARACVDPNR